MPPLLRNHPVPTFSDEHGVSIPGLVPFIQLQSASFGGYFALFDINLVRFILPLENKRVVSPILENVYSF